MLSWISRFRPYGTYEQVKYGDFPVPKDWGISGKDYYEDAYKVTQHMKYATQV